MTICAGPIRANCVVDGDTFWFEGTKISVADIDAPDRTTMHSRGAGQRCGETQTAQPF